MPQLGTAGAVSGGIYAPYGVTASADGGVLVSLPVNTGNELGTLEITIMQDAYNNSKGYITNIQHAQNDYLTWGNKLTFAGMKYNRKMIKLQNAAGGYGWATGSVTQTLHWKGNTWGAEAYDWQNVGTTSQYWSVDYSPPIPVREHWRIQIKKNLTPSLESRNSVLMQSNNNSAELRARMLLRDLVGDEEFRRYLVRGFIVVKGKTGIIYRVPGGHERIVSYVKDAAGKYKPFEAFCIVFKKENLPHTDSVVMRKLLLESDEFELRKMANVSQSSEVRPRFNGELFKPIPLLKVAV